MEGLSLAFSCTKMDSSVAINMIQACDIDRSLFSSLVKKIKYLMGLRRIVLLTLVVFRIELPTLWRTLLV